MLSRKRRRSINEEKSQQQVKRNKNEEKSPETLKNILSMSKVKKMTPEKLRSFKGFEKIGKKKAKEIINTLEVYCEIIIHHMRLKKEKL